MIKIAVIGAGHWGPNLIRNFDNKLTSEVAWVVDRDEARLTQVRKRFPSLRTTTDVSEALNDTKVDAVVIATPTATHFKVTKAALEAGKHVLVEKPITNNSREALELCDVAEKHKRILMVGHVFVYNGAVQRVKRYVDGNELGRLFYISMTRTNLGPIRMDVSAAWDLASHDISICNYWLGATPLTVSSTGGSWINKGIHDAVFAVVRYPNDVIVNIHASWLNPRKNRDVTVVGDRKMLTFDDMNMLEPIRIYDKGVAETKTTPGFVDTFASFRASVREGEITIPNVSLGEPLKNECDHFLACVASGEQPISSGRWSVSVVQTLEALDRSIANQGREEKVV